MSTPSLQGTARIHNPKASQNGPNCSAGKIVKKTAVTSKTGGPPQRDPQSFAGCPSRLAPDFFSTANNNLEPGGLNLDPDAL
jgi:hypothetical protein